MRMTDACANRVLELLTGKTAFATPTTHLGLGTSKSSEVSYTGYARLATVGGNWAAAASRAISNSAGFTFGTRTDAGAVVKARYVLLYDALTSGNLNAFAPIVGTNVAKPCTITRSGSVATITCTGHGYAVNDEVDISGANQSEYEGNFVVASVPDANTFTVAVSGTPATPATAELASIRCVKLSPIDIGQNSQPNLAASALTGSFPE